MQDTFQTLQNTLVAQVKSREIEGVIQTLETLLAKTTPNPDDRETPAFQAFARVVSTAAQEGDIVRPEDLVIQSLLLSALMGAEAFRKKVLHQRLDLENQKRQRQAERRLTLSH
jgi:hypothetical protein